MTRTDPILVEVIHNYLLSAAREMQRNLIRTSYNTIIYEIHDFGLGIYDDQCNLLAEAPGLAVFTRGNDYGLRKVVEFLGEDNIHPGDLILLNYPYWSSAHILDVLAVSPIFHGDELVGFTAVKQHWLDLAQKDPGYCLDTTDVHQEGLILPCSKIYERGVLNRQVLNLIRFNTRMPDRVIGDMHAQISSCRTGERRVQELVARFGVDTYREAVTEILDHGERLARAGLAKLPQGHLDGPRLPGRRRHRHGPAGEDAGHGDRVGHGDDRGLVRLRSRRQGPHQPAHRLHHGHQRPGVQGHHDSRQPRQCR